MILSLPGGLAATRPVQVPQRRRVIVIGATEAGVSAAFHLGKSAVLIEQRTTEGEFHGQSNGFTLGASRNRDVGSSEAHPHVPAKTVPPAGVRRWQPPELIPHGSRQPRASWNYLLSEIPALTSGEVLLGSRVALINHAEHSLRLASGDSFVYDKLISTLRLQDLRRLIVDEKPSTLDPQQWRDWLNGRDIELLDVGTQIVYGDMDGAAGGARVAIRVASEMAAKYAVTTAVTRRAAALFQPRLIPSAQRRI
jgi:hypothetical protein